MKHNTIRLKTVKVTSGTSCVISNSNITPTQISNLNSEHLITGTRGNCGNISNLPLS